VKVTHQLRNRYCATQKYEAVRLSYTVQENCYLGFSPFTSFLLIPEFMHYYSRPTFLTKWNNITAVSLLALTFDPAIGMLFRNVRLDPNFTGIDIRLCYSSYLRLSVPQIQNTMKVKTEASVPAYLYP
jgi:hypothetical protein